MVEIPKEKIMELARKFVDEILSVDEDLSYRNTLIVVKALEFARNYRKLEASDGTNGNE